MRSPFLVAVGIRDAFASLMGLVLSEPMPLLVEGSTLLCGRARGDDIGGEKVVRVGASTASESLQHLSIIIGRK
jgi:hypothetical protein